jgi:dTDP-4-amino-4,6-dideoxygalactose transaminase
MPVRYDGMPFGKTRDDLLEMLNKYNLKAIVQYWPLNRSSLFKTFGWGQADVPVTDHYFNNMIGFPWWSDMPDELIDDMAERTRLSLEELRKQDYLKQI